MTGYLLRRLLLVIPTLFGIIAINFAVIQFAPGGPVEQMVAELRGKGELSSRLGSATSETGGAGSYRGARGLDPHIVADIKKMFGFDKPPLTRFADMLGGYLRFDFGRSFFRDQTVVQLILQRLPVSISLGLWSTLLVYFVSIPLGIAKAVRDGSRFDLASSAVVLIGYAIPSFLFAILLVVLFAGGSYFHWFPLRRKQYTVTARAKGASERRVLYGHVFRNAMLLIVAGFPHAFISILFTSALLVEIVFSLDGIGLLGFQSAIQRDYPVMFGTLYIFTLLGLLMQIVGDTLYTVVDPRIDFESRR
jgi:microcin C transport system permease protein